MKIGLNQRFWYRSLILSWFGGKRPTREQENDVWNSFWKLAQVKSHFWHCLPRARILQKTGFCIIRLSELMSLKRFSLVRSSELVSVKRFALTRLSEAMSLKRGSLELIFPACGRIDFLMNFKDSWDSLTVWRSFPMENGSVCDRYAYIPKIDWIYNFSKGRLVMDWYCLWMEN